MKSNSWKKDYLVVMHDDYDNTWSEKTIPLTLMQALRFVQAKKWGRAMEKGTVCIVTHAEWANFPKHEVLA